jgi:hypothetical protein
VPDLLSRGCDTQDCPSLITLPEALYWHEPPQGWCVLSEGDRIQNELDRLCKDAGWAKSLGDWQCPACRKEAKEQADLEVRMEFTHDPERLAFAKLARRA